MSKSLKIFIVVQAIFILVGVGIFIILTTIPKQNKQADGTQNLEGEVLPGDGAEELENTIELCR